MGFLDKLLGRGKQAAGDVAHRALLPFGDPRSDGIGRCAHGNEVRRQRDDDRSEERRAGTECRSRWPPHH